MGPENKIKTYSSATTFTTFFKWKFTESKRDSYPVNFRLNGLEEKVSITAINKSSKSNVITNNKVHTENS